MQNDDIFIETRKSVDKIILKLDQIVYFLNNNDKYKNIPEVISIKEKYDDLKNKGYVYSIQTRDITLLTKVKSDLELLSAKLINIEDIIEKGKTESPKEEVVVKTNPLEIEIKSNIEFFKEKIEAIKRIIDSNANPELNESYLRALKNYEIKYNNQLERLSNLENPSNNEGKNVKRF